MASEKVGGSGVTSTLIYVVQYLYEDVVIDILLSLVEAVISSP